jgi:hypothetical protein
MNTSDQLLVAASLLVVGVVTVCVCLPLIYRKIPMNRFYGIRISQAFASEERWYAINARGGRLLASWSCLITATGLAGLLMPLRFFSGLCRHRRLRRSHQCGRPTGSDYPLGESQRSLILPLVA